MSLKKLYLATLTITLGVITTIFILNTIHPVIVFTAVVATVVFFLLKAVKKNTN